MFRQDFLLRQINALAEATARIAGLVRKKRLPEARVELDVAGKTLLGLDVGALEALSDDDLVAFCSTDGQLDGSRMYAMAELVRLSALVVEADGQDGKQRRVRALDLLLVGWLGDPTLRHQKVDQLIRGLEFQTRGDRPRLLTDRIVEWATKTRQLALVEDLVFEGSAPEGALWALAALTDEELAKGGLPRIELEAALSELATRR